MLDRDTVSQMADGEISAAVALLSAESERRERERSRHEKAGLSKSNKRDPRCPECKARLMGDGENERKMKLMSNCCSYLRHCFESHNGIKFAKLEAYGNFFLYRWSHVRKHGLKATIDLLFNRVCGTPKSDLSSNLF